MSGLGVCPACSRKGFIRRSAETCMRCEKAAAQPVAVAVVERVIVAEVPAALVAEARERSIADAVVAQALAPDPIPPARVPRKRRPYLRSMGRIVFNDEIGEE